MISLIRRENLLFCLYLCQICLKMMFTARLYVAFSHAYFTFAAPDDSILLPGVSSCSGELELPACVKLFSGMLPELGDTMLNTHAYVSDTREVCSAIRGVPSVACRLMFGLAMEALTSSFDYLALCFNDRGESKVNCPSPDESVLSRMNYAWRRAYTSYKETPIGIFTNSSASHWNALNNRLQSLTAADGWVHPQIHLYAPLALLEFSQATVDEIR
jgi:hypothetical protein